MLIEIVLLIILFLFFYFRKQRREGISTDYPIIHQPRYSRPTYNNPIGNVLPYQGVTSGYLINPSDGSRLRHGMIQDDLLGKRLGLRQFIPSEPRPDKTGHMIYSYGTTLQSCKSNRMACLPTINFV